MNTATTLFFALAALLSVVDWAAVARGSKPLEYLAKPAATTMFLLAAMTLDAADGVPRAWRVAALVLCLAGDVFLMLPNDSFVQGLGSFAVAQVLFVVSFVTQEPSTTGWIIGVAVAVPVTFLLARRFIGALGSAGEKALVAPVTIYMAVITAMVVSAISGGTGLGIAGAVAFMVSDSLIAETRFVKPWQWGGVAIMATYHLALAGLVLGLL